MQRRSKKTGLLAQLEEFLNLAGKQQIGIGTFAEVFKVYDKRDQTYKALRQLEKGKQTAEEIEQEREINQKLMKINHPNILKVFEIFEDEELICYLTEYCQGGSLWDTLNFIKGKRFTQIQAVEIVLETARAVQVLHNHGITHRDLKPENILFVQQFERDKGFHVKLADFGLSTNKMLMETIAGTKQYIAPEQIRKEKYTKAVDVWALGIIFDELIHGVPYFTGDSHQETFHMIAHKDFRVRNDSLSLQTKNILTRMIKRYPGQRPKIEQVIQKLQQIIEALSSESNSKHQKQSNAGRKFTQDLIEPQLTQENDFYCTKHLDQFILRKRGAKQSSCLKCIDDDPQLVPIQQYLKILSYQNLSKKQQMFTLPQFQHLNNHSLSGFCKNQKISKQLHQRKQSMLQGFSRIKQKYSFLNVETLKDQQIGLLQKCSTELKQTGQQLTKTVANYNQMVLATLDSKLQKFLDNYFKDI